MSKHGFMGNLQRLGKALMTPVAVLPAAALLLRLGADDVFKLKWMSAAGDAIFGNLALIFAIGIAIGFADENNGVAGLAATVGYFVMTKVAGTFNAAINMGVLAGIIAGLLAGFLYNKYKAIKLPDFLGFFGGKRFVPIVTSFWCLLIGIAAGYIWPLIQDAINSFGTFIATSGAIGGFIFLVLMGALIAKLYRKANPERALMRTGLGGGKVITDGGTIVLPFLQQITEVNLQTLRLEVQRRNQDALITRDRLRVDVRAEFYVRVAKNVDSIMVAAQTLGFIWLGIGVAILIVLYATGRRPHLAGLSEEVEEAR